MVAELYTKEILLLAGRISHIGRLKNPHSSAEKHSRLCGSSIVVDICVTDNIITDFAQEIASCILGQASASIVGEHIIGLSVEEFWQVKATVDAMLKKKTAPPVGAFSVFQELTGAYLYKNRHEAIMLVFHAIEECLKKLGYENHL